MANLPYQSLHGHTNDSDGLLTHEQVLDTCAQNKIGVFGFTDHDVIPTPETVDRLKKLNHPVKFISGIEISCDTIPEYQGKLPTFHITGLFIDITNPALNEFSQHQLDDRRIRMQKFVKNLTEKGFLITEEEVMSFVQGGAIVQPHTVSALKSHPENLELLEKFYQDLQDKAKTDPFRQKQVEEIQSRKENQKWYVLVMSKDSLHTCYVQYQNSDPISADYAIKLIRDAGGVAMVAHWSYLRDKFTIKIVEDYLKTNRLDGMETVYAFGIEKNRDVFVGDMLELSRLCEKYNKIQGGGGDFHKPEDWALMINPNFSNFADRTKGMVERILELHPNLNRDWSTV